MSATDFWDNPESAQKDIAEMNQLKTAVNPVIDYKRRADDLGVMLELLEEEEDTDEAHQQLNELQGNINAMLEEVDRLEIASFLSGPLDATNAYLSIQAGAGGTESCDWAEMLLRMYTRWAERWHFRCEIQDMQLGEEAGINSASLRLVGQNAYGYAKAERGVHRLVRISPFDSNARRHTSFCAVDVVAEIEKDFDVEVNDEDLRIDTFRSSGKGGQHVNTTDSAVRITHIPTNIVAACQSERSQHKNRATAMRVLKSKLYEKKQDEQRAEMERFYGDKGEIGWGNQIRNYVFHPYQLVKDLRTGTETGNTSAVMDGDLDAFIHDWLRAGSPQSRQDVQQANKQS